MLVEQARDAAARILAELPQEVHDALEHVQVRVVAWTPPGMRSDAQAVFIGRQQEGDPDDDEEEDVVRAKGEILVIASNLSSDEEVEQAVLHEIGHALGLDEFGVAELGL